MEKGCGNGFPFYHGIFSTLGHMRRLPGAGHRSDWRVSPLLPRLPKSHPPESEPQASPCPFENTRNPQEGSSVLGSSMLSVSPPKARPPTSQTPLTPSILSAPPPPVYPWPLLSLCLPAQPLESKHLLTTLLGSGHQPLSGAFLLLNSPFCSLEAHLAPSPSPS